LLPIAVKADTGAKVPLGLDLLLANAECSNSVGSFASGGQPAFSVRVEGSSLFPWVKFRVPEGELDLSAYQFVTAEIENRGRSNVSVSLWVCPAGGWHPVEQVLELAPGEKSSFKVNLRKAFGDQTPRLDPRRIRHLRLVLHRPPPDAEVVLSNVAAMGKSAGPFVPPPGRLVVPEMTGEAPAPGQRVREQLPAHRSTDLYHALYLPEDWKPGGRYPIIVEYTGNEWFEGCHSTGLPEDGNMGYGMSKGRGYIWVGAPCVNKSRDAVQKFWADEQATADYAVELVRWICGTYGGDPGAVFLTGFSRGGIYCNRIGLHNEEVAGLWLAFHACQGYETDGSPGALGERMPRIRGRATFHTDNDRPEFRKMFEPFDFPAEWMSSGLGYHADAMLLDDRPSTLALRQWMADVLDRRPGTGSVTGVVKTAAGQPVPGARVESGLHFVLTDGEGRYVLHSLAPGPRTLSASVPGSTRQVEKKISISTENLHDVDLVIE
jgi:hypothetical protein